ncbi:DUF1294 domain-containing protein [Alkaliphilus hydrothermalis]|uniref:Uncharacterized membrane protein YsdA (DUF1294 family) n=1 Tax=Alkaliphilus hydrothermalis TaxID=1482730 RepID=A0ABS2NN31_9FIRM|nr:DUF1294 domain-containing protein [Alkaliphilus hydrothermalis]MBM7614355.1 uncharacterized membrane protein YsdA (DUF1294 family) [Alkaliphilus hydrothermalis]
MEFINELAKEVSTVFMIYISISLLISIAGFALMGYDKYRAKQGEYRISELTLMAFSFFGGAIGVLLGMVCFHHKISKKKFYIGVPALYIFNQIFHLIIFYRTMKL